MMKRIIYLSVLIALLTACNSNKDFPTSIIIGDIDNMIVNDVDYTFKGVYVGVNEVNTRTVAFDIDNDGEVDFSLTSTADTIENGGGDIPFYSYSVGIQSDYIDVSRNYNTELNLSVQPVDGDTIVNGSFYITKHYSYWECESNTYDVGNNSFVNVFQLYNEITLDELSDYHNSEYIYSGVNIYKSKEYEVSSSSYFTIRESDYSCLSAPKNTPFYISVHKVNDNKARLGWIELEILEDNTVHLIRTAIQG